LFIVGFGLVMSVSSRYGPAIGGDSADYLSTADHISKGEGFINLEGNPYRTWPPLYPLMLGSINVLLGIDNLVAGWALNALFFAATLTVAGALIQKVFHDQPEWFFIGTITMLSSRSLVSIAASIGADSLFVLFTVVFFLVASRYYEKKDTLSLIALAGISGLGILLRWNGIIFILTGCLLLIYTHRNKWRKAIRRLIFFGVGASFPISIWVGTIIQQNDSTLFGRIFITRDFWVNLSDMYIRMTNWFIPLYLSSIISSMYLIAVLLAVLLIINNKRDWRRFFSRVGEPTVFIAIVFTGFYLLLVALTTINADHPDIFDDRYLSPIFIVVILVLFIGLKELIIVHFRMQEKAARLLLIIVFSLWLTYPIKTLRTYALESINDGVTTYNAINTRRYNESETLEFARDLLFEQGIPISSNYPEAVYFFTRLDVIDAPFNARKVDTPERRLCLAMADFRGKPISYLIWFWPNSYKRYIAPKGLQRMFEVTTFYESEDGGIYLVNYENVVGRDTESCEP